MDIEVAPKCLGEVDVDALRTRILEQEPAAWQEQLLRKQEYEVHFDSESIVLLFCDEEWPEDEIYREGGWGGQGIIVNPQRDLVAVYASYYKEDYSEVKLETVVFELLESVFGATK